MKYAQFQNITHPNAKINPIKNPEAVLLLKKDIGQFKFSFFFHFFLEFIYCIEHTHA